MPYQVCVRQTKDFCDVINVDTSSIVYTTSNINEAMSFIQRTGLVRVDGYFTTDGKFVYNG